MICVFMLRSMDSLSHSGLVVGHYAVKCNFLCCVDVIQDKNNNGVSTGTAVVIKATAHIVCAC